MTTTRRSILQTAAAAAATRFLLAGDVVPYHEVCRPQFHFTPKTGWHNDPNGLLWYKGEYHLFFQHNPTQLEHALLPDKMGTMFSGSGVVDRDNTAGLQKGDQLNLKIHPVKSISMARRSSSNVIPDYNSRA
jgi:sucrose-6-phosphate hydrolase SacC (GH32 family)